MSFHELRTDKISGLVVVCFGMFMIVFGTFALSIILLQSLIFKTMPPIPVGPDGFDFTTTMRKMHALWWTYMPITIAGGLVFAVCGRLIYRGSNAARRIAQFNAVLGYVWGIAYAWSCSQLVDAFPVPGMVMDDSVVEVIKIGSLFLNLLFELMFPTAILFLLSRPKSQTMDAIVC